MFTPLRAFFLGCAVTAVLLVTGNTFLNRSEKPIPRTETILVTNKHSQKPWSSEIQYLPRSKKVFNVSVVAYTAELAKKLGLPPDYITTELTPGMHSLEVRIETIADHTRCRFNTLLDDSLPLDFPEQPLFVESTGGAISLLKAIIPDTLIHQFRQDRLLAFGYYDRNVYIATANYDPVNPQKPMRMMQPGVERIYKSYLPNMTWLSVNSFGCNSFIVNILSASNPTLWMKKKGGRDYTKISGASHKEDFMQFVIPKSLIDQILPVIKEAAAEEIAALSKQPK